MNIMRRMNQARIANAANQVPDEKPAKVKPAKKKKAKKRSKKK